MAFSKAERLQKIRDYLYGLSPLGASSAQVAREFELSRSGALKNLRSASAVWPEIYQNDDLLWYFNPRSRLIELSLTPEEVRIMHLAARLYSRLMPKGLPASVSALNKMARASESASPVSAAWIRETALELEQDKSRQDESYISVLRRIHQALEEQQSLRFKYEKKDGSSAVYRVLPLFLEPYGDGRSLYLCARDLDQSRYLTLKTERISEVRFYGESRSLLKASSEFEDQSRRIAEHRKTLRELLKRSWGIWASTGETELVRLLFSAEAARRVEETQWHPSQRLIPHDSGLIWEGDISSPMEMYPWIRSWGSSVQVLEPQWLRSLIIS